MKSNLSLQKAIFDFIKEIIGESLFYVLFELDYSNRLTSLLFNCDNEILMNLWFELFNEHKKKLEIDENYKKEYTKNIKRKLFVNQPIKKSFEFIFPFSNEIHEILMKFFKVNKDTIDSINKNDEKNENKNFDIMNFLQEFSDYFQKEIPIVSKVIRQNYDNKEFYNRFLQDFCHLICNQPEPPKINYYNFVKEIMKVIYIRKNISDYYIFYANFKDIINIFYNFCEENNEFITIDEICNLIAENIIVNNEYRQVEEKLYNDLLNIYFKKIYPSIQNLQYLMEKKINWINVAQKTNAFFDSIRMKYYFKFEIKHKTKKLIYLEILCKFYYIYCEINNIGIDILATSSEKLIEILKNESLNNFIEDDEKQNELFVEEIEKIILQKKSLFQNLKEEDGRLFYYNMLMIDIKQINAENLHKGLNILKKLFNNFVKDFPDYITSKKKLVNISVQKSLIEFNLIILRFLNCINYEEICNYFSKKINNLINEDEEEIGEILLQKIDDNLANKVDIDDPLALLLAYDLEIFLKDAVEIFEAEEEAAEEEENNENNENNEINEKNENNDNYEEILEKEENIDNEEILEKEVEKNQNEEDEDEDENIIKNEDKNEQEGFNIIEFANKNNIFEYISNFIENPNKENIMSKLISITIIKCIFNNYIYRYFLDKINSKFSFPEYIYKSLNTFFEKLKEESAKGHLDGINLFLIKTLYNNDQLFLIKLKKYLFSIDGQDFDFLKKFFLDENSEINLNMNPWACLKNFNSFFESVQNSLELNNNSEILEKMEKNEGNKKMLLYFGLVSKFLIDPLENELSEKNKTLKKKILEQNFLHNLQYNRNEQNLIDFVLSNFYKEKNINKYEIMEIVHKNNIKDQEWTIFHTLYIISVGGVLLLNDNKNNYFSYLIQNIDKALSKNNFIPFIINDKESLLFKSLNENLTRYKCTNCGTTFLVGDCGNTTEKGICSNCKKPVGNKVDYYQSRTDYNIPSEFTKKIDNNKINFAKQEVNVQQIPGYINIDPFSLDANYKLRSLKQFSFRIGHIILHASIFLSYIINQNIDLRDILSEDYYLNFLIQQITHDWKIIKTLKNNISDEEILFILFKVLESLSNCEDKNFLSFNFDKFENREKWEISFEKLIVNEIEKDLPNILDLFKNNNKKGKNKKLTIYDYLRENIEDETLMKENKFLHHQFRTTFVPDNQIAVEKITTIGENENIELLKYLLNLKEIMKYFEEDGKTLIIWYQKMYKLFNNKLYENEQNDLDLVKSLDNPELIKELENSIIPIWNKLVNELKFEYQCAKNINLQNLNMNNCKAGYFLLNEKSPLGQNFYLLLKYLADMQNKILEQCSNAEININFLKLPLHMVSEQNLLCPLTEEPSYYLYIMPGLFCKQGNILYTNFKKLEELLSFQLLAGKTILDIENTLKVNFKSKMSNLTILFDIKNIIPQVELNEDQIEQIHSIRNTEDECDLFFNLESCLKILNQMKGIKDRYLIDFMKNFKLFNPKFGESLKS